MSELYYIYKMGEDRRRDARVITETEASKLKGQVVLCGATYHLKAGVYGLLFCKPEDYPHWEAYAKKNSAKIVEWENGELLAPNGRLIADKSRKSLKYVRG